MCVWLCGFALNCIDLESKPELKPESNHIELNQNREYEWNGMCKHFRYSIIICMNYVIFSTIFTLILAYYTLNKANRSLFQIAIIPSIILIVYSGEKKRNANEKEQNQIAN